MPADQDEIVVSGVSKIYPGASSPVLTGIDLRISAGSFFTIIGPSGAGKSTLLRVMAGLTTPSTGEVSVFGEPPSQASRAKHLGWVPQSPALLPWRTVLDNVRLPLQVNKKTAASAMDPDLLLAVLGLDAAKHMLPSQLSGGMRQRAALARAFAFRPKLLLMDEPFGALDEMTREHVGHLLLELWQQERRTVVFVTHSVAEAVVLSDRVAVMGGGKLSPAVDITLSRPRPEGIEDTEQFQQLCTRLRGQLRTAYART
ncbi:MAG TPA: ABC transporter ATP-binding protein [Acidimicrobiales bacterium]|nr:ABC transporter ATP-binding protein [Acidimicrobiales bacterium]